MLCSTRECFRRRLLSVSRCGYCMWSYDSTWKTSRAVHQVWMKRSNRSLSPAMLTSFSSALSGRMHAPPSHHTNMKPSCGISKRHPRHLPPDGPPSATPHGRPAPFPNPRSQKKRPPISGRTAGRRRRCDSSGGGGGGGGIGPGYTQPRHQAGGASGRKRRA